MYKASILSGVQHQAEADHCRLKGYLRLAQPKVIKSNVYKQLLADVITIAEK